MTKTKAGIQVPSPEPRPQEKWLLDGDFAQLSEKVCAQAVADLREHYFSALDASHIRPILAKCTRYYPLAGEEIWSDYSSGFAQAIYTSSRVGPATFHQSDVEALYSDWAAVTKDFSDIYECVERVITALGEAVQMAGKPEGGGRTSEQSNTGHNSAGQLDGSRLTAESELGPA
jgi:hypothetical protein